MMVSRTLHTPGKATEGKLHEKKKSITGSIYMKHQKYNKSIEDLDVKTFRIFLPGPRRWATSHFQKVFTCFSLKLMWHISLCRRLHPGKQRGKNQRRAKVHTKRHIKAPATKTTSEFLRRRARLWVHFLFQTIHTTGTCEPKKQWKARRNSNFNSFVNSMVQVMQRWSMRSTADFFSTFSQSE